MNNKVAVITGASRGIGRATAMAFARSGCNLALSARNREELNRVVQETQKLGVKSIGVAADVRRRDQVEEFARRTISELGSVQFLINNAGIGRFSEVVSMSDEDFHATLETNLFGVFYCTRAFLPSMIENKQGHIVNVASLAGKNSFAEGAAYCASKHALISFSECVMLEVRHHNIKVSTICPGSVQTEFGKGSAEKSWALTAEDVADAVMDMVSTSSGSLISLVDLRPLKPQKR